MAKSYEEQIKEMQNKISALKKKAKEQEKQRAQSLGEAFFRLVPEAKEAFDEEGFKVEDYLKEKLGMIEDIPEYVPEENAAEEVEEVKTPETSNNAGAYNQQNYGQRSF